MYFLFGWTIAPLWINAKAQGTLCHKRFQSRIKRSRAKFIG